jgi:predicted transcriptional regulator
VSVSLAAPEKRASRRERVPKRGVRLRDRDVEILLAIAKMRLVRTTEITRLFFEAKGTAQKRLRKLFDAGLVRAVVTDLASENRFAITRLGHALLDEALDSDDVPAFRPPPKVEGRAVVHLDLLNAYRVGLAVGAATHGVEVVSFRPDWELRASAPNASLVPDALVSIDARGKTLGLALEVDAGTEALSVVRRKLLRYAEIHARNSLLFGMQVDMLVFLVEGRRRARSMAKLLSGSGAARMVFIGVPPLVMETGGFVSGVSTPEGLASGAQEEQLAGILPAQSGFWARP